MKRSALKRTAGPKRRSALKRSPMRRRKGSTKYSRRERDRERMLWIKTQRCALVAGETRSPGDPVRPVAFVMWPYHKYPDPCRGEIEAHHAGEHGTGNKAPDDTCVPMCVHHHRSITGKPGGRGCFTGWPRGTVKAWELAVAAYYQRRYAERDLSEKEEPIW